MMILTADEGEASAQLQQKPGNGKRIDDLGAPALSSIPGN
jgi:hypothetical protein